MNALLKLKIKIFVFRKIEFGLFSSNENQYFFKKRLLYLQINCWSQKTSFLLEIPVETGTPIC